MKCDDKSNEITAIPELLEILDISGCIITIDAIGCQSKIGTIFALDHLSPPRAEGALRRSRNYAKRKRLRYAAAKLLDSGT